MTSAIDHYLADQVARHLLIGSQTEEERHSMWMSLAASEAGIGALQRMGEWT